MERSDTEASEASEEEEEEERGRGGGEGGFEDAAATNEASSKV